MSLRSSTEYEIARPPHRLFHRTVMPAEAGIQGREGMDTGFRRYDETFVPNRRLDPTCRFIFEGGTEFAEFGVIPYQVYFTPRPLRLRDTISEL